MDTPAAHRKPPGKASIPTKRRLARQIAGILPPEVRDAHRRLAGMKGAIAQGKIPRYETDPKVQALIIREQSIGVSLVVPCLERIGQIALGMVERTPIATQLQAGQYIVDRYGRAKSDGGGDAPVNELPAIELLEALRALQNEAGKRSAEDAEPAQSDQQSAAPPAESNT